MSEPTESFLKVNHLDELFDKFAPEEWKSLPNSINANEMSDDGKFYSYKPVIKKCEGETPTEDEVKELFAFMSELKPYKWLCRLAYLQVPSFPEGQDPTVKEFFEGTFDSSQMKSKVILVSYPLVEAK